MGDANIVVTLYKNKGDRSDCNNYRDILLLSIVDKLFARIKLTTKASWPSMSRVTLRLSLKEIYNRHGLLTDPAIRKNVESNINPFTSPS